MEIFLVQRPCKTPIWNPCPGSLRPFLSCDANNREAWSKSLTTMVEEMQTRMYCHAHRYSNYRMFAIRTHVATKPRNSYNVYITILRVWKYFCFELLQIFMGFLFCKSFWTVIPFLLYFQTSTETRLMTLFNRHGSDRPSHRLASTLQSYTYRNISCWYIRDVWKTRIWNNPCTSSHRATLFELRTKQTSMTHMCHTIHILCWFKTRITDMVPEMYTRMYCHALWLSNDRIL